MPADHATAPPPVLRSEPVRSTLRGFLDLLDDRLLPTGPAGGPAWTTAQRVAPWHRIESGWPSGLLTCWTPPGSRTSYLLDGNRRVATIRQATASTGTPLWRDVEGTSPTTTTGRPGWTDGFPPPPCSALDLLRATRQWPGHTRRRAEHDAAAVCRAPIDLLLSSGGQPRQAQHLCIRLLASGLRTASSPPSPGPAAHRHAGNPSLPRGTPPAQPVPA